MIIRGGENIYPREIEEVLFTLAAHKIPRRWELTDALPRTPSGKVQKFVLRERLSGG